jgi:acyl carrier protein
MHDLMRSNENLLSYIERREEVLGRVRRLLIACLDLQHAPDDIDPDTPLFGTGLGLDSVDAVELVISLEMEFGMQLPDGDERRLALRSVNALVDTILDSRMGAA